MPQLMTRKHQTCLTEMDVRLLVITICCEARLLFLFACISAPFAILLPYLLPLIQRTSFFHNSTSFLSIIHSIRV